MIILFVICGILWLVAFGVLLRHTIIRQSGTSAHDWSHTRMLWFRMRATLRQQLLAYWSLSLGVFTVFAVGLCRPDFSDGDTMRTATGGYQAYIDSRVPIQYDLNSSEVRHKLSLSELPPSTNFLQFLRHREDEASCMNLNQVATPTVLGVDLEKMTPFGLKPIKPFAGFCVYVDEESLIWSLMRQTGDTLYYSTDMGERTPVIIAGTYPTGVFHGNAIMDRQTFRTLWGDESGTQVMLVKTPDTDAATELLSVAMAEYGLDIQDTTDRIKMFFEVTDTYLVIFLTLGGIGLLLGVFTMLVIVRKSITASRDDITLLRTLGFTTDTIRSLFVRENVIVPLYAVITGATGALISISANVTGAGGSTIALAAVSLLILCASVIFGIKLIINKTIGYEKEIH